MDSKQLMNIQKLREALESFTKRLVRARIYTRHSYTSLVELSSLVELARASYTSLVELSRASYTSLESFVELERC